MTDPPRESGFSSTKAQRTTVLIGTVVLLILGLGLTAATGAGTAQRHAAPASIKSYRALDVTPSSATASQTAGQQQSTARPKASPAKPAASSKPKAPAASATPQKQGSSTPHKTPKQKRPSASKGEEEEKDHETVKPPVRDDDHDESDESSEGRSEPDSSGTNPSD